MGDQFGVHGSFHQPFREALQSSMFVKDLFRRLTAPH